jgi:HAMP domain-containing protein
MVFRFAVILGKELLTAVIATVLRVAAKTDEQALSPLGIAAHNYALTSFFRFFP